MRTRTHSKFLHTRFMFLFTFFRLSDPLLFPFKLLLSSKDLLFNFAREELNSRYYFSKETFEVLFLTEAYQRLISVRGISHIGWRKVSLELEYLPRSQWNHAVWISVYLHAIRLFPTGSAEIGVDIIVLYYSMILVSWILS